MIGLAHTHRPLYQGPRLGQAIVPAAKPPAPAAPSVSKPAAVITGLALTGLSAAIAYVGISYGMEKKNSDFKRALGWTVGVLGVIQGLGRLVGTAALAFTPAETLV